MRITTFIGGSGLLLGAWLGFAFIREVPPRKYPLIEKSLTGRVVSEAPAAQVALLDESQADR